MFFSQQQHEMSMQMTFSEFQKSTAILILSASLSAVPSLAQATNKIGRAHV